MNNKKRFAASLLCLTMAAGTMTVHAEEAPEMSTDPITFSIMGRVPEGFKTEDNQMLEILTERTGVTLKYDVPPMSNYSERLQTAVATDEMSDVTYTWGFGAGTYQKWGIDGMLWELDDLVTKYPNLMANIPENQWEAARVPETGKIYAVPKPNSGNTIYGFQVNLEWLNELADGKIPETTDELYEFAKKVAESDPDGNGQKDTFLFSPTGVWSDRWIVQAFMPYGSGASAVRLPDFDGEYKIREKMNGYMPFLQYMRKLYTEGLIDPEFFTNNTYDDRTKFGQKRVAICSGYVGPGTSGSLSVHLAGLLEGSGPEIDPDVVKDYVVFSPNMKAPEQEKPTMETGANHWGGWMFKSDLDLETVERILSFMDWANTEEGWLLMNGGAEGVHYTSYDPELGAVIRTQEQIDATQGNTNVYASIAAAYRGNQLNYVTEGNENSLRTLEVNKAEYESNLEKVDLVNIPSVLLPKMNEWTTNNPDLTDKLTNMEENFVTGNLSEEEFTKFLDEEYFPSIAEAEEEYIQIMNDYAASQAE